MVQLHNDNYLFSTRTTLLLASKQSKPLFKKKKREMWLKPKKTED